MVDYRRPESRQNGLTLPPPPSDVADPWTAPETQHSVTPQTLSGPAYIPLLEQVLINQREMLTWQQRTAVELRELKNKKRLDVKVQDFNMPFGAMIGFFIKIALALIPAAIFFGFLMITFAGTLFAGLLRALIAK